jgi:hypothetical protein
MTPDRSLVHAAGLILLTAGMARAAAAPGYQIRRIVQLGDTVGDVRLKAGGHFQVGTLNDSEQLIFAPSNANGSDSEALIEYAGGQFIPIVIPGQTGPLGTWPRNVGIAAPVSMNRMGNVVFGTAQLPAGPSLGVFRRDSKTEQITSIALRGMPAVNNLTFADGGGATPAINNQDEIAFAAGIKNAAGKVAQGVFFLGRDGVLQSVVLPDHPLPGGGKVDTALFAYLSLNDAGVVGFQVQRQGEKGKSGYLWEKGELTPVAVVGQDAPGGGKFAAVTAVRVNNKNRMALVAARLKSGGPDVLYRFANGQLTPVLLPGQAMPDGSTFKALQSYELDAVGVSAANEAGQHVILARLDEAGQSRTAAYLLEEDGSLSLILKSGATTDLGVITAIGGRNGQDGVGFNSQGQVAVPARFGSGPDTLLLLTPTGR